jgi:NADH-quinone oxidoreductase subunit I
MYGLGVLKGLGITLKHFVATFTQDVKTGVTKHTDAGFSERQGMKGTGIYTVEYPD